MSFQTIQQMSGYAMVAQSTRLGLVAEALSYSGVPAASASEVLQPGRALLQARPLPVSASSPDNSVPAFAVEVARIVKENGAPQVRYQPGHPLANDQGEVFYPDISTVEEMATMMSAARDFDAAVTVFNSARQMQGQVLELIAL
ncbi:flagellar basal body rod protein FlgC [Endozoicomonas sp.]|uniref:flagellar basal body rod protein FlgC n=1 Tax=Endozoicomonas sp. TaxID=1892382 RepID=UPI00383A6422